MLKLRTNSWETLVHAYNHNVLIKIMIQELAKQVICKILYGFGFGLGMGLSFKVVQNKRMTYPTT